jgi:hypothetical protein
VSEGNGRDTDPEGTEPAPKDPEGKLSYQLAELELAIYRVGELMRDVNLTVLQLRLAQQTEEHRVNVIQDAVAVAQDQGADHERRIAAIEARPSTAAE